MEDISCKILLILILTHNYHLQMFENCIKAKNFGIYINESPALSILPADGPSSVEIRGVGVVTVGIPYGFECTAYCYPGCQYTWTRGNLTSQGPELTLQLLHRVPTQTLTCTVVNPTTGISATVHKTLQVTGMNDQAEDESS